MPYETPSRPQFSRHVSDFFEARRQVIALYIEFPRLHRQRSEINWLSAIDDRLLQSDFQGHLSTTLYRELLKQRTPQPNNLVLFSLELVSATDRLRAAYDEELRNRGRPADPELPNPGVTRRNRIKSQISASSIVLESIKDLLGDAAPAWVKISVIIAKEGADMLLL